MAQQQTLVAEALAQQIERRGLTTFGVVGNGNIHMVSTIENAGCTYVGMRHEAGAVAAADAHFRATGEVAVATTTYGPGLTNAVTPLTEALAARVPVIVVSGGEPFIDGVASPRPIDIDSLALLRSIGVHTLVVSPSTAASAIDRAFDRATTFREPVVVLVPHNVVDAPVQPDVTPSAEAPLPDVLTTDCLGSDDSGHRPDSAAVDHAAELLANELRTAHRPLILVGRGVVETGTEALAQRMGDAVGALFATTAMACGAVDPRWSLGICGGFAHRGRLEAFRDADLVLVLGAGMNALQMRKGTIFGSDARIVRVEWDPHEQTQRHKNPAVPVAETISVPLEQLLPRVCERLGSPHAPSAQTPQGSQSGQNPQLTQLTQPTEQTQRSWREAIGAIPPAEREELDPGCFAEVGEDGRLDPRFVLRQLNTLLPAQRSVVTDGGHFLGWVGKYLEAPDPRGLVLVGGAVMTIGLGLSSATGVAVARPDRYTVAVGGDGGTQMGLADIGAFLSAIRAGGGGALVVLNDEAYGAEIHQYASRGLNVSPMLLEEMSFAELGRAFGVPGAVIDSPEQLRPGGEAENLLRQPACILDVRISRVPVADFLRE